MGTVFKYVSDEALASRRVEYPCPVCGTNENVYPIDAKVTVPGKEQPVAIGEACLNCIRRMPLEEISEWETEQVVADHLRSSFPDLPGEELEHRREAICRELRGTPRIPLFWQVDEWPFCCGDLAECVGTLEGEYTWSSSFRCSRCGRDYHVVHMT